MLKKCFVLIALVAFVILLNGCAAGRKRKDLEIQGLKNQVTVLETQIQSKDNEINSLKDSLAKTEEEKQTQGKILSTKKKVIMEVKSRPNTKQIQLALKNAGYESGIIDGRMGRQTREAIKAFQKANNLPAYGKVGKQTWGLLKAYLYQKLK